MKIMVFSQNNSGEHKTSGILEYGKGIEDLVIKNINDSLPDFVENPEDYISISFGDADLVLNYLGHPDLSFYLMEQCTKLQIPMVASGKKSDNKMVYTPFTCCGLGKHKDLGNYGESFGFPEYTVKVEAGKIVDITVVRGAPCAATWKVIPEVVGHTPEEALVLLSRLVQYNCSANPARFDPVTEKSPVHFAGYVHRIALEKALQNSV